MNGFLLYRRNFSGNNSIRSIHRQHRQDGTAQWFFETSKFKSWLNDSGATLWCPYPSQYPELYKGGQQVYVRGPRGVGSKPVRIQQLLGDGQYRLSRDGLCDGKVYRKEALQTEPRYQARSVDV